ncbi:hypothetical protein FHR95_003150 [Halomonas fontilapidosi]|uniref:Uncharacterized protein n=1 Tax=Halomonas fontilapidosi TaxID=616675 RepID=A0A7W5DMD1_9GAMM|nr:hypothetical protein [Halomonas fontilapidosi]
MKEAMLEVDRHVQYYHADDHGQPYRDRYQIEEAPVLLGGNQGSPHGGERKEQTYRQGIEDHDG